MTTEGEKILDRPLHVQTPLLRSRKLSNKAGCSVWLKLDNVQNSGSFKVRGLGYHCQKVSLSTRVGATCPMSVCFVRWYGMVALSW